MTRRIALVLALASALLGSCLGHVAVAAPSVVETVHRNESSGKLTIHGLHVSGTGRVFFLGSGVRPVEGHYLVASRFDLRLLALYSTGHSDLASQACPSDFQPRHEREGEASGVAPLPVPTPHYYDYLPQHQEVSLRGAPPAAHSMRLCWYINPAGQYGRWLALESLIRF